MSPGVVVLIDVNGSVKRESVCGVAVAKKSKLSAKYPSYFVAVKPAPPPTVCAPERPRFTVTPLAADAYAAVSLPAFPSSVSLPAPPVSVSFPAPPLSVLFPASPVSVSPWADPVIFSTLLIVSVPAPPPTA